MLPQLDGCALSAWHGAVGSWQLATAAPPDVAFPRRVSGAGALMSVQWLTCGGGTAGRNPGGATAVVRARAAATGSALTSPMAQRRARCSMHSGLAPLYGGPYYPRRGLVLLRADDGVEDAADEANKEEEDASKPKQTKK